LPSISDTGISSLTFAGVVTDTELKTQVGPAVQAQIVAYLSAQCTGEAVPPVCGCTPRLKRFLPTDIVTVRAEAIPKPAPITTSLA